MGGFEARTLVLVEPSLRYHPCVLMILTARMKRTVGQCLLGSLTGAVSLTFFGAIPENDGGMC